MHLGLRVDGGPEIGYGHLMRSGALATEFLTRGHRVTYVTTTPERVGKVCPDDGDIIAVSERGDPAPFVEWIESASPDFVFTDAYPVDTEYQRTIRSYVPLAVHQDDTRHTVCADVFVNGNLSAGSLDYDYIAPVPRECLGTNYTLLRNEIRTLTTRSPPWRDTPKRALITMGGSDVANLTPTVIRAFEGFDLRLDAIVGPGFSQQQESEVRKAASSVTADVHVVRNPENLPERMFQADFAVTTSSTTTYELLALGTPIICRPVVDNQEPIARALDRRDAATVLDREDGESAFRQGILEYMSNETLRRRRRNRGLQLVDGRGTERVFRELLTFVDENWR